MIFEDCIVKKEEKMIINFITKLKQSALEHLYISLQTVLILKDTFNLFPRQDFNRPIRCVYIANLNMILLVCY